jgi:hypothetical protein
MKASFSKSVIVIERVRDKSAHQLPDKYASNKFYEMALTALCKQRVLTLFSASREETASLLNTCAQSEALANESLPETWATDQSERMKARIRFLGSIPHLNMVSCWALAHASSFPTLHHLLLR